MLGGSSVLESRSSQIPPPQSCYAFRSTCRLHVTSHVSLCLWACCLCSAACSPATPCLFSSACLFVVCLRARCLFACSSVCFKKTARFSFLWGRCVPPGSTPAPPGRRPCTRFSSPRIRSGKSVDAVLRQGVATRFWPFYFLLIELPNP